MALTHVFPATRWSLIRRLEDSVSPVGMLLERYAAAIRAYLGLKFPADGAEALDDLAQEVLCVLLERPEILRKAEADTSRRFRFYLMGVAWNLARNARRRLADAARVDHERAVDEAVAQESEADPDDMDAAWAQALLAQALEDCRGWEAEGELESGSVAMLEANLSGDGVRAIGKRHDLSPATCARHIAAVRSAMMGALRDHLVAAGELEEGADPAAAYAVLQTAFQPRGAS